LVLGFSVVDVTMVACFYLFGQVYLALGTNPTNHFWLKFFWKLGYNLHLELLIGFLAYLEPKLWLKNTIFDKN